MFDKRTTALKIISPMTQSTFFSLIRILQPFSVLDIPSEMFNSFQCQTSYVNCNIFIKSFSVPDSPFRSFPVEKAPFQLFVTPRFTLITERCTGLDPEGLKTGGH